MALPKPEPFTRIVRDPRIVGGEPTVKGTRIPVRSIVLFREHEGSLADIFKAFPRLTADDVREALAYYEAHRAEIDGYIRENQDDGG